MEPPAHPGSERTSQPRVPDLRSRPTLPFPPRGLPGASPGHTPPPRTAPQLSFTMPATPRLGLPFHLRPEQAVVGSAGDLHLSKRRGKRGCIRSPGDCEGAWGWKPAWSLEKSTSRPFPPAAPVLSGVCPRGGAPECSGLADVFQVVHLP